MIITKYLMVTAEIKTIALDPGDRRKKITLIDVLPLSVSYFI